MILDQQQVNGTTQRRVARWSPAGWHQAGHEEMGNEKFWQEHYTEEVAQAIMMDTRRPA
jgi:hypothetical protein